MSKSGIPYVLNPDGTQGENWNPVSGCPEDQYNAICRDRCWARGQATRLPGAHGGYREVWHKNGLDVYRTTPEAVPFSELVYHPDRIDWPLHWVKPRTVFVGSMGDLFHEQVSEEFIVKVSRTIARARQHWYLLLTKRWRRMARLTHLMLPELRAAGDSIWWGFSAWDTGSMEEVLQPSGAASYRAIMYGSAWNHCSALSPPEPHSASSTKSSSAVNLAQAAARAPTSG